MYRQGRYDESSALLDEAADKAADDDVATRVFVRTGRAKLSAQRGQGPEAVALAAEAVALAAATEIVDLRGDALLGLAEVLRREGRNAEAAEALHEAIALWDAKRNVIYAAKARALLSELGVAPVENTGSTV
jgi:tetratricopeptide (TPR) repeat protein